MLRRSFLPTLLGSISSLPLLSLPISLITQKNQPSSHSKAITEPLENLVIVKDYATGLGSVENPILEHHKYHESKDTESHVSKLLEDGHTVLLVKHDQTPQIMYRL